jgi:uncharacterized membrane protein
MLDDRDHALEAAQGLNENHAAPAEPKLPTPPRGARLGIALAVLALVGFSLALCVQTLLIGRTSQAFYASNVLGAPGRLRLLVSLGVGALLPVLAAGGYALRKRAAAQPRLERLARLLCPLLLSGFLPGFFVWEFGQKSTLQYLFLLVLLVLATQCLWRISLREWATVQAPGFLARPWSRFSQFCDRHASALALGTVLLAAAGYAAYTGYYTVRQHRLIQTFAFDLGIYDNLMSGALHGKLFRSPVLFGDMRHNYLAGHAEYGMLLFLPFYALRPGAETLLILQSLLLGFSAVPLFLFARTRLSQGLSALLSVAYLLFAPLHGPNFYDFHWLPLAIFFHFWLYFALATRRTWLAIAMVLVLFSIREDIALGLSVLGAFLCLTGERVRFGLGLFLVSVVWFVINKFVIMRLAGSWWFENIYVELFADGQSGYGSILKTILSNPTYTLTTLAREPKLVYFFHLLTPLAFLPVRRLALVALLLPGFFFTLLTTNYWPTTSIAFQYTTHWIPYLFLATALSLWLMGREPDGKVKRRAAVIALVFALTSHSYNFGAILQRQSFVGGFSNIKFQSAPDSVKRYDALMQLVRRIPPEASVAATEYLNPHVSARVEAYTFRYDVPVVDYILVSKLEVSGDTSRFLTSLLKKADYGLVGEGFQEFYLFKKGAPAGDVAAALSSLRIRLDGKERKKRR